MNEQQLRENALRLWNEHSFIERTDKNVRALMTVDSFFFCIGALYEQKDKRIASLQESEMRLIDANSRQEQRIAELEATIESLNGHLDATKRALELEHRINRQ